MTQLSEQLLSVSKDPGSETVISKLLNINLLLTERKKTKLKKISPGMGDLKSLFYFHLLATLTSYLSTVTFKVFVNSDDKLFNILLPDNG